MTIMTTTTIMTIMTYLVQLLHVVPGGVDLEVGLGQTLGDEEPPT